MFDLLIKYIGDYPDLWDVFDLSDETKILLKIENWEKKVNLLSER